MRFVAAIPIFIAICGSALLSNAVLQTQALAHIAPAKPVSVRFALASFRVRNVNNVAIYAVNAIALNRCNCKDCFKVQNQVPPKTCNDKSLLFLQKTVGCIKAFPNRPVSMEPGEYWILVTERINNVERPVWTTKRKIVANGEMRL